MFKHLWVECGMLSGLSKKTCILVIVILSSTLAAGIVQDRARVSSLGTTLHNTMHAKRASQGFIGKAERTRGTK